MMALDEKNLSLPEPKDLRMRIAADGTWFHEGRPIRRPALVKLFAGILSRDENGKYWLTTPVERGEIAVEDVPFLAVEVAVEQDVSGGQIVRFRTNLDEWVVVDENHAIRVTSDVATGLPKPYIHVRDGLEARIARSTFYHLIEEAEERQVDGRPAMGVLSCGHFFVLGALDDDAETDEI